MRNVDVGAYSLTSAVYNLYPLNLPMHYLQGGGDYIE